MSEEKNTTVRKRIAARLRDRRMIMGYTQREVAESAGLTPDWVNHFEAGRRLPTIPILIALCDALEVSADRILGL
jgi:transcriptional regulator with XRE-family HTH domain